MSKSPAAAKRQRANKAVRRRASLEDAVNSGATKAWRKLSEYHYQRSYKGKSIDWWPSTGKANVKGEIVRVDSEQEIYEIFNEK